MIENIDENGESRMEKKPKFKSPFTNFHAIHGVAITAFFGSFVPGPYS
jgi:hypothetical protein